MIPTVSKGRRIRLAYLKEKLLKANSTYEVFKPLLFIGSVLGFPMTYFYENGIIKTKTFKRYLLQMLVMLFIYGYCCFVVLHNDQDHLSVVDPGSSSPLLKSTVRIRIISGICLVVFLYVTMFFHIAYHGSNFMHLDELKHIFYTAGIEQKFSMTKLKILQMILIQTFLYFGQIFMNLAVLGFWDTGRGMHICLMSAMYFPGYVTSTIVMHFVNLVIQANDGLIIINSELELIIERKLMSKSDSEYTNLHAKTTTKRQKSLLKRLSTNERDCIVLDRVMIFWRAYDNICDYTESVNETYSTKLVPIFLLSFGMIVYNLFLFLTMLFLRSNWVQMGKEDPKFFVFLGSSVEELCVHINMCCMMIVHCAKCKNLVST